MWQRLINMMRDVYVCGGDKSSQNRDIKKAKALAAMLKE